MGERGTLLFTVVGSNSTAAELIGDIERVYYIARTRPGTDFPETLLSQTDGQWRGVISALDDDDGDADSKSDDEGEDGLELPKRVTVRDVLKYSLT